MPTPIGFTMPLSKDPGVLGSLVTTMGSLDATLQNMKSLVLTNWGERVNHYYFGCNLREYLFEQITSETTEQIKQRIEAQVAQWLPYVDILEIFVSDDESNRIKIFINFGIKGRQDLSSVLEVVLPAGA